MADDGKPGDKSSDDASEATGSLGAPFGAPPPPSRGAAPSLGPIPVPTAPIPPPSGGTGGPSGPIPTFTSPLTAPGPTDGGLATPAEPLGGGGLDGLIGFEGGGLETPQTGPTGPDPAAETRPVHAPAFGVGTDGLATLEPGPTEETALGSGTDSGLFGTEPGMAGPEATEPLFEASTTDSELPDAFETERPPDEDSLVQDLYAGREAAHATVDIEPTWVGPPEGEDPSDTLPAVAAGGGGDRRTALIALGVGTALGAVLTGGLFFITDSVEQRFIDSDQSLQAGPGGQEVFPTVAALERNEQVDVLEEGVDYALIRDPIGRVGYVLKAYLASDPKPLDPNDAFTRCRRRLNETDEVACAGRARTQQSSCETQCEVGELGESCIEKCQGHFDRCLVGCRGPVESALPETQPNVGAGAPSAVPTLAETVDEALDEELPEETVTSAKSKPKIKNARKVKKRKKRHRKRKKGRRGRGD